MSSEVQEQEVVIVYSEWNKLIIPFAEKKHKAKFNILKYGTALLIAIISLISLWFAAKWQTPNVLSTIGIDVTKWNNYLSTEDVLGNKELIAKIAGFHLWDLNGAVLTRDGVQVLVAFGIISLSSLIPLLIFKNGTAWSIGSIAMAWVFLVIVLTLFAMGLDSQSNAIKVNTIPLDTTALDKINQLIADNQSMIIVPAGDSLLTPQEQISNNKYNNLINDLIQEKNNLLSDFMKTLNDYLILL